jgi:RNA polymerase sigma-70 factor (ECF subfamily)
MTKDAIEVVFRSERGRILASLIRLARNFDDAEDVLADALLEAHIHWGEDPPRNPGAWLLTVAKRKLLDKRRAHQRRGQLLSQHQHLLTDQDSPDEVADDVLRLVFTCCHPVLSGEAQIALTLRTLGGLTTSEVARAFLVEEETMAQRLVRAKRKIASAGVRYAIPATDQLPSRLDSVLRVIYLIFNEGYAATSGDALERRDLCHEALRLVHLLNSWLPAQAEVEGLFALLALIHSRRDARVDGRGRLVTLDQQDRALWRHSEIREAIAMLERALARKSPGPMQLQAAIMAVHCEAPSAAQTDWRQIRHLYKALLHFDASPTVLLNYAVALAQDDGWAAAENILDDLAGLENYYPYHAARAHCAFALGKEIEARAAFQKALSLTKNQVERDYLTAKLNELIRAQTAQS